MAFNTRSLRLTPIGGYSNIRARAGLGQIKVVLASHVILHDALVLEEHEADVALGGEAAGVRGPVLVPHVPPEAAHVVVATAHRTLRLPVPAA